jgi:putative oxidoreductase
LVLAVLTLVTISTTYRSGAVFLPRRNVELYRNLAILGGLLFYFVSGPGAWSLGGGTSRRA